MKGRGGREGEKRIRRTTAKRRGGRKGRPSAMRRRSNELGVEIRSEIKGWEKRTRDRRRQKANDDDRG